MSCTLEVQLTTTLLHYYIYIYITQNNNNYADIGQLANQHPLAKFHGRLFVTQLQLARFTKPMILTQLQLANFFGTLIHTQLQQARKLCGIHIHSKPKRNPFQQNQTILIGYIAPSWLCIFMLLHEEIERLKINMYIRLHHF